jgi:hypothetical protein
MAIVEAAAALKIKVLNPQRAIMEHSDQIEKVDDMPEGESKEESS